MTSDRLPSPAVLADVASLQRRVAELEAQLKQRESLTDEHSRRYQKVLYSLPHGIIVL